MGDDLFGYVAERLDLQDLRQQVAGIAKTLKHNKALESCKINGLLFRSLDANGHFASRSRCGSGCGQRQVQVLEPDGQQGQVTAYYHPYVFARINGPKINVGLDVEPIRPGEDECAAALRRLGRVRRRHVQLWEVTDLPFSDGYGQSVGVVRSAEHWIQNRVRGGLKESQVRSTEWRWAASAQLNGYGAGLIYQAGHRCWGIENKAFNELTQAYHLEHCSPHEPLAMLAQMLILVLGFTLFTAFAQLQSKRVILGKLTAKALAKELDLALEADLPWELWIHSG